MTTLKAQSLTLAYDRRTIVQDLDLELPQGSITIVVGANGSGKSTLLCGLSRLLKPEGGSVMLDGRSIHTQSPRQVARKLGLLPQSPTAPEGITVRDLVARGRFPHHGLFRSLTRADQDAIDRALAATGLTQEQDRVTSELSGGQRQRAWIAMALAQETDLLLLDEPTTYLDVAHQMEVLDVVAQLNRERGTTVVIVLHDLNLAARYADHMVAMKQGAIVAAGDPREVVTAELVQNVFGLAAQVVSDPHTGTPLVVPVERTSRAKRPAEQVHSSLVMRTEVSAIQELSPTFLRLTLSGPDLARFGVGGHPLDLRIKIVVPPTTPSPRTDAPTTDPLASLRPGALVSDADAADWYKHWLQIPEQVRGVLRTYSVRDFRPALHPGNLTAYPELDVDVVRHVGGRASDYLRALVIGDTLELLGPNRDLVGPEWGGIAFRPGGSRHLLLAGDETAAPAILSILSALPAQFTGDGLIEVPHEGDIQPHITRSSVQVRWLVRGSAESGTLLDPAVRETVTPPPFLAPGEEPEEIDIDADLLWETSSGGSLPFYAWLAGEAGVIKQLRRYLVGEAGLDRSQVSFMGYWRRGRAEG